MAWKWISRLVSREPRDAEGEGREAEVPTSPPIQRPAGVASSSWLQRPAISPEVEREIVGESRHRDTLEELAGGRTKDGTRIRHLTAELVLEPENPYDPDAIRVDVGGKAVGSIPRRETDDYRELIRDLWSQGRHATCRARLIGGWDRGGGDRGHIGVNLIAGFPPRPFWNGFPFLPPGHRVTVTREEHFQDDLEQLLVNENEREGIATLKWPDEDSTGAEPHAAVSVWLDSRRVGYLTAKMSERYAPLLGAAEDAGLPTTCHAWLWRDKKVEVRLDLATPDQCLVE